MKRITLLALTCFLLSTLQISAQSKSKLKKVLELKMPKTAGDIDCGTNGGSVAWHPEQKKYYASFAGNSYYPFGVFDVKGERLSDDNLTALKDVRGLWYDPVFQKIYGNPFNNEAWFSYTLDENGIILNSNIDSDYESDDLDLPPAQNAGALDTLTKRVAFINIAGGIDYYSDEYFSVYADGNLTIHFGKKKTDPNEEKLNAIPESYNTTTVIYTGIKKAQLGFLNVDETQIELYDDKTGLLTKILTLPKDASVEKALNFAYANKIYWLFNIATRTWIGYK